LRPTKNGKDYTYKDFEDEEKRTGEQDSAQLKIRWFQNFVEPKKRELKLEPCYQEFKEKNPPPKDDDDDEDEGDRRGRGKGKKQSQRGSGSMDGKDEEEDDEEEEEAPIIAASVAPIVASSGNNAATEYSETLAEISLDKRTCNDVDADKLLELNSHPEQAADGLPPGWRTSTTPALAVTSTPAPALAPAAHSSISSANYFPTNAAGARAAVTGRATDVIAVELGTAAGSASGDGAGATELSAPSCSELTPDLEAWLKAIKLGIYEESVGTKLRVFQQEEGIAEPTDILDLDPEQIEGLCTNLKKISEKKLRKAIEALRKKRLQEA
jgi:hypothetical protein